MKGPMTTQSLRGMANAGPMHWRGDRSGANNPGGDDLDEDAAFKRFNPAFVGLLGRTAQLTATEMQQFTDFILSVRYPPNPIRNLDNSATGAQSAGQSFFNTTNTDAGAITCAFCHALPLGTQGLMSVEGETQEFKIAHLRNAYQKVGMFGIPDAFGPGGIPPTGPVGPQVRGFGFLHDGSIATVFAFLNADVFLNFDDTSRSNVEAFIHAFDAGLRPIVGQQVSATPTTLNDGTVTGRINLLIARDEAGDCDLVVKGVLSNVSRGWVFDNPSNQFRSDRASEALVSEATLRGQAATAGQERTYTCVPPGSGTRIGIDRDLDGFFDRTEIDAGSDPANPASIPGGPTTTTTTTAPGSTTTTTMPPGPPIVPIQTSSFTLRDDASSSSRRRVSFKSSTKSDPPANRVIAPVPGSAGDPTLHGATLEVYNPTTGQVESENLSLSTWQLLGSATNPRGYRFKGVGAVTRVSVKDDKITLKGGGVAWGYSLADSPQTSVAVRLRLGNGTTWCAHAVNPRHDTTERFQATPRTQPPVVCPPLP
jgi:hypothetical protein